MDKVEKAPNKGGRPPKAQETETFEITVPKAAHGYLKFLAKNSMLGPTLNDVAALILVNELTDMARTKFHDQVIPQG